MPREYNIKWTENQRKKLNSAVRKYNNAIRRAARNNPMMVEAGVLPSEVSYNELKAEILTARALKNTVNRLTRITKPDALDLVQQYDGSIVTKYERREYSILRSVRERQKKAELSRAEKEKRHIPSARKAGLTPDIRPISSLSVTSIKRFIDKQAYWQNEPKHIKVDRYVRNYVKALYSEFGGFPEYDAMIQRVEDIIIAISPDFDFMKDAMENAPDITYMYDPIERQIKMRRILEYWEGVAYAL